ncbi:MAG: C4-dicarboxylate ABC transporter [Calditrichaeota bacterium]|nr:MAG: C4-dicarboxylate ABC transporter [Calditrichota bacterium]
MSELMPLILFITLFGLLMAGFPVAFTLGGVSIFFGVLTFGFDFFNLLPLRIWGVMSNFVLLAVPLFVFMGVMLEKSGIAEELLETMALLFGRLRGGLAISVIIVGTLLAASTGIVGATVVTMGMMSLPTMLKRGYSAELASGTICASGTLGQIIPPSIVLVLLGSILNIPVGDLFIGAIIPGIVLVGLYLLWIVFIAIFRPEAAPSMPREIVDAFKGTVMSGRIFKAFLPPFALIITVLGSILAGIASPTEAAAVGALGAIILTALRGKLTMSTLRNVSRETTFLTCMVFIILVGATAFGLVFRGMGGDRLLADFIIGNNLGPHTFLAIVMIIVFIAGFFIDFFEICFIIVPVVAPIFVSMGIDLLWFGVLIAINLQTSFLTPPFGFSLFYLKGVAPPEVSTQMIYKGIIPFIIIQLIGLGLVILFPETATMLPKLIIGQ